MARKLTHQQEFELAQSLRRAPEAKSRQSLGHQVFDAPEELRISRRQKRSKRVNLALVQGQDDRGRRSVIVELFFLISLIALIYIISKLCLSLLTAV